MDRCGVERAVLIQLLGQFDNDYQQACLLRFPGRFASVVAVDPARADAVQTLERLADSGAAGVRLRSNARSPGSDPLAIWRRAESLALVVSCAGPAQSFLSSEFEELVGGLPRLPIILEHLGGLARPDVGDISEAAPRVMALWRHPRVYLKVPGLGQLAPRAPSLGHTMPLDASKAAIVRQALEAFGAQRLMWGSDFPVVASREGYANALTWMREALADAPAGERDLVFGDAALRLFWNAR